MSVPRDAAAYLHRVLVAMPGGGNLDLGYRYLNPNPMTVFYDDVEPILQEVFEAHDVQIIGFDLQASGVLMVRIGTVLEEKDLNEMIKHFLGEL